MVMLCYVMLYLFADTRLNAKAFQIVIATTVVGQSESYSGERKDLKSNRESAELLTPGQLCNMQQHGTERPLTSAYCETRMPGLDRK